MYPIALIVVNGIITGKQRSRGEGLALICTAGDLYFSVQGGVKSRAAYALYALYYFLYGGRGIVFAAVGTCLSTSSDPGLAWHVCGSLLAEGMS